MVAEKEFLYKELTSDVLDSSFKIHNSLGCDLLEKVYGNALAWELELRKRKVVHQKEYRVV
jgi:GxxExxY protein